MTIAKLRGLSKYGVIVDPDPYNLPPEAFTMGVNVRFKQGSVEPAPVFRRVPLTLAQSSPRYAATNFPTSGFDNLLIGYKNGRVYLYDGTEHNYSIAGYVDADSDEPFTSCRLGDVFYVNRPDRVPWYLKVTDTQFSALTNWDATWRAKILRSSNSRLIAFGITKGATTYPSMIKSSEAATVNSVPITWDETDTNHNAYENILAELEGEITEAQPMGGSVYVYGIKQTYKMTPTGTNDIWDLGDGPLFDDVGCIGVNCAVSVDSTQYVFGINDIWKHDGVSKRSICDARTRKFIFRNANMKKTDQFFVSYDKPREEVRFYYVSTDSYVHFSGVDGCNRCAVYNIIEDTWTFDDLPFVFGATVANIDSTGLTWATVTTTWETMGGSYSDQGDGLKRTLLMLGDVASSFSLSASLYAMDDSGPDSAVAFAVDVNANAPRTLERDGIDLDELPEVETLEGYKVVSTIWPQARLDTDADPLMFSFGAANQYNETPTFTEEQSYDGITDVRCDFNDGGRYFFFRMTHDDYKWFKYSGCDLDLRGIGDR